MESMEVALTKLQAGWNAVLAEVQEEQQEKRRVARAQEVITLRARITALEAEVAHLRARLPYRPSFVDL